MRDTPVLLLTAASVGGSGRASIEGHSSVRCYLRTLSPIANIRCGLLATEWRKAEFNGVRALLCAALALAGATLPCRSADSFAGGASAVAFSPDGRWLAVRGKGEGPDLIEVREAASDRLVRRLEPGYGGGPQALAFSPDGEVLASGAGYDVALWAPATGRRLRTLTGSASFPAGLTFGPQGAWLAAIGGKRLLFWDLLVKKSKPRELTRWEGDAEVSGLALSPDGRWLAACGRVFANARVEVYDARTWARVHAGSYKDFGCRSVAFSPRGDTLALGGYRPHGASPDSAVQLWEVPAWKPRRVLEEGRSAEVVSVAFNPDGRWLAAVAMHQQEAMVWEVATGRLAGRLAGIKVERHGSVAFSPNGGRVAAAGRKGLRLWDFPGGLSSAGPAPVPTVRDRRDATRRKVRDHYEPPKEKRRNRR